jgi:kynurenine formamidase
MELKITLNSKVYHADMHEPLDISIPLWEGERGVNCFYAPYLESSPVVAGDFIGSTAQGGPVNFMNVRINPHGNGTHTECVGHIAKAPYSINQCLKTYHFPARLISIYPSRQENNDRVILKSQITESLEDEIIPEALIIRTLPNDDLKLHATYSGSNPPYVDAAGISWLVEKGVKHFLIDLPSVDREQDGGALSAHHAFWNYPENPRTDCTISELIYVNNSIPDGLYLLNLQIASFEIDVSPSKPVLYPLREAE